MRRRLAMTVVGIALLGAVTDARAFSLFFSDDNLEQIDLTTFTYTDPPAFTVQAAQQTVNGPYDASGSAIGITSYNNKPDANGNFLDNGSLYGADPAQPGVEDTGNTANRFFVGEFRIPGDGSGQAGSYGTVVLANHTFSLPDPGSSFTSAAAQIDVRNLLNLDGSNGGGSFTVSFLLAQVDANNQIRYYSKALSGGQNNNNGQTNQANQADWLRFGGTSNADLVAWSAFNGQPIFGNAGATPDPTLDTVFGFFVSSTNVQVSTDRWAAFAADNFRVRVEGNGTVTTSTFNYEAIAVPEPRATLLALVAAVLGFSRRRRFVR